MDGPLAEQALWFWAVLTEFSQPPERKLHINGLINQVQGLKTNSWIQNTK